jgi:hypothetical protein
MFSMGGERQVTENISTIFATFELHLPSFRRYNQAFPVAYHEHLLFCTFFTTEASGRKGFHSLQKGEKIHPKKKAMPLPEHRFLTY